MLLTKEYGFVNSRKKFMSLVWKVEDLYLQVFSFFIMLVI